MNKKRKTVSNIPTLMPPSQGALWGRCLEGYYHNLCFFCCSIIPWKQAGCGTEEVIARMSWGSWGRTKATKRCQRLLAIPEGIWVFRNRI